MPEVEVIATRADGARYWDLRVTVDGIVRRAALPDALGLTVNEAYDAVLAGRVIDGVIAS